MTIAAPAQDNDTVKLELTAVDGNVKATDNHVVEVDDLAKGGARPVYRPPVIRPPVGVIVPGKNAGSSNSWQTGLLVLPLLLLLVARVKNYEI